MGKVFWKLWNWAQRHFFRSGDREIPGLSAADRDRQELDALHDRMHAEILYRRNGLQ